MDPSLIRALSQPRNPAVLGLAFIFGGCAAWWLLPVGLAVWLVMVLGSLGDPGG